MEHYTSIKQSVKLLGLGLDPSSSDMCWEYMENCDGNFPYYSHPECHKAEEENDIPCWSVGALMKILPNEYPYNTCIYYTSGGWCCDINAEQEPEVDGMHYEYPKELAVFYNDNIVDSLYEMVCWLLENGYIDKTKQ